jgi:hypothetical protein
MFIDFIEVLRAPKSFVISRRQNGKSYKKNLIIQMQENIYLINMSSDEFFARLKETFAEAMFAPEPNEGVKVKKHYVYGIQGICDLFGCSPATAARIKKSGAIDAAISQVGNTIVVDAKSTLGRFRPLFFLRFRKDL